MIKRGTYKICKLILSGSVFTCFMLQSCGSYETYNYGGDASKPANSTGQPSISTEEVRNSIQAQELRESQRESRQVRDSKKSEAERQGSRKSESPKTTGCLG